MRSFGWWYQASSFSLTSEQSGYVHHVVDVHVVDMHTSSSTVYQYAQINMQMGREHFACNVKLIICAASSMHFL